MDDKLKDLEDCQWLSHAEFVDKDSVRITITDNTTNEVLYTFNFSIPEDEAIVCDGPIKEFTELIRSHVKNKDEVNEEIIRDLLSGQAYTLPHSRFMNEQGFTCIPQFTRGWRIRPKYGNLSIRYIVD